MFTPFAISTAIDSHLILSIDKKDDFGMLSCTLVQYAFMHDWIWAIADVQ